MFERIVAFLKQLPGEDAAPETRDDDPRIAAAALMFHVMDADGVRDEEETERLKKLLSENYGLSGDTLDTVIDAGEEADRESVDFYAFTSVLMRHLDHAARVEFIGILWEMVFADGEVHELEDNTVWRVAELIGVEREDRIAMRQQVQARLGGAAGGG